MGNLSANFSTKEFACSHCGLIGPISQQLVDVLQRMRTMRGRPLTIVSGLRCVTFNRRVGGVKNSQHLKGRAADVPRGFGTAQEWIDCGAIGVGVRAGGVIHVDVTPGVKPFIFND